MKQPRFASIAYCGVLALIVAVLGCSGKKRLTTTVEGTVTYNGAPVTVGAVYFYGEDDQMGMGNINADGTFLATDVPVGEVRVSLQVRDPGAYSQQMNNKASPDLPGKDRKAPVTKVPAKYADPASSGLKYTIPSGMKNLEIRLD